MKCIIQSNLHKYYIHKYKYTFKYLEIYFTVFVQLCIGYTYFTHSKKYAEKELNLKTHTQLNTLQQQL